MCNGHLECINVSKHRADLLTKETRPVHSSPYQAVSTAAQFSAAEINLKIAKNVIEPETTEREAPTVLASKENGTIHFCVDSQKQNTATVRSPCPLSRMHEYIDRLGE